MRILIKCNPKLFKFTCQEDVGTLLGAPEARPRSVLSICNGLEELASPPPRKPFNYFISNLKKEQTSLPARVLKGKSRIIKGIIWIPIGVIYNFIREIQFPRTS